MKTKEVEIRIFTKYTISLMTSVFLLLTKFTEVDLVPTEISKKISVDLRGIWSRPCTENQAK